MRNKGWVKFYRGIFIHWISERKPWCDAFAWCYLYAQANHKSGMVNMRNEYIEVKRGQFLTSKLKLQNLFGWTYKRVSSFLKALKNDEMVTIRTTNRYIVITIVKYEHYQLSVEEKVEQKVEQRVELEPNAGRTRQYKQECIKNDLRMKKKLTVAQHKKNTENATRARDKFLEIIKKDKEGE